jgi:hypothetical protein
VHIPERTAQRRAIRLRFIRQRDALIRLGEQAQPGQRLAVEQLGCRLGDVLVRVVRDCQRGGGIRAGPGKRWERRLERDLPRKKATASAFYVDRTIRRDNTSNVYLEDETHMDGFATNDQNTKFNFKAF